MMRRDEDVTEREGWMRRNATTGLPMFDTKEQAQDAIEQGRSRHTLGDIRAAMVALYLERTRGAGWAYVTADDAADYLDTIPHADRPPASVLSVVFRGHGWTFTGAWVKSKRPRNHASDLRCWAWAP